MFSPEWHAEWRREAIDVDAFLERCRRLRNPLPGNILRFWNDEARKCQWCVVLRVLPGEQTVRVATGERLNKRYREIALANLLGWSIEAQALRTLADTRFDVDKALAALDQSYAAVGYWRDKFGAWTADEAVAVVEQAQRYPEDIGRLATSAPSKTLIEIGEFYDHLLHSGEGTMVGRLFKIAAVMRANPDIEDPDGELRSAHRERVRASKREKRLQLPLLPGEDESEDETTFSQASSTGVRKKRRRVDSGRTGAGSEGKKSKGQQGGRATARGGKDTKGAESKQTKKIKPGKEDQNTKQHSQGAKGGSKQASAKPSKRASGSRPGTAFFEQFQRAGWRKVSRAEKSMLAKSFDFLALAESQLDKRRFTSLLHTLAALFDKTVTPHDVIMDVENLIGHKPKISAQFQSFLAAA